MTDGKAIRERLRQAHLMLVFTPELCGERDPVDVVAAALDAVDVIQVRPKPLGTSAAPAPAHETLEWCTRVLELVASRPDCDALVLVDDRVDVARELRDQGCAGVHLGQDDCPVPEARELLGPEPLIGYSTHDVRQVALAGELPVDYLGFGPFRATDTKGYEEGLGSERAWVAHSTSLRPVFPIGGIDAVGAVELAPIGRAAVSSAILAADDPGRAARELREILTAEDYG